MMIVLLHNLQFFLCYFHIKLLDNNCTLSKQKRQKHTYIRTVYYLLQENEKNKNWKTKPNFFLACNDSSVTLFVLKNRWLSMRHVYTNGTLGFEIGTKQQCQHRVTRVEQIALNADIACDEKYTCIIHTMIQLYQEDLEGNVYNMYYVNIEGSYV